MKDGQNISLEELIGKNDAVKLVTVGDKNESKSKVVRGLVLGAIFSMGVVVSPYAINGSEIAVDLFKSSVSEQMDHVSTLIDKAKGLYLSAEKSVLLNTKDLIDDHLKSFSNDDKLAVDNNKNLSSNSNNEYAESSKVELKMDSKVNLKSASKGLSINSGLMKANYTPNNNQFVSDNKLTQKGLNFYSGLSEPIEKTVESGASVKSNIKYLEKESINGNKYAKSQLKVARDMTIGFMAELNKLEDDLNNKVKDKSNNEVAILVKDYYSELSERSVTLEENISDIVADVKDEANLESCEYDDIFSPGR